MCWEFFWDLIRYDHWGFHVKCIFRYWELTLRNEHELGACMANGVQWKEENRVFNQDLLDLLGMGADSEERPQLVVCYRPGDQIRGFEGEEEK